MKSNTGFIEICNVHEMLIQVGLCIGEILATRERNDMERIDIFMNDYLDSFWYRVLVVGVSHWKIDPLAYSDREFFAREHLSLQDVFGWESMVGGSRLRKLKTIELLLRESVNQGGLVFLTGADLDAIAGEI